MSAIHVVTHRAWMARELAAATGPATEVLGSLGLDVPAWSPGDSVWAPMEWAARACAVDRRLALVDPGPHLLEWFPARLAGRTVHLTDLRSLAEAHERLGGADVAVPGFYKPANAKIERLPASWTDRADFLAAAERAGCPGSMLVHWTTTRLDLVEEHRVFVVGGEPATSSPYLQHHDDGTSTTWHEGMASDHVASAREFATDALTWAHGFHGALPAAFTLDVGLLRTGDWAVIETNPAWCSAWYGADLAAVATAIEASSRVEDQWAPRSWHEAEAADRWRWSPDPYLAAAAARARPLPGGPRT